MPTPGTLELSAFLADWVTPHLRAAGHRKSHHTYRRTTSAGDAAGVQFRAYALGVLGSFLLDVWVTPEPFWDLVHFDPDGTPAFPERPQTYDAAVHWQQGSTVAAPTTGFSGGAWTYDSVAERDQVGHHIRDLLLGRLLPDVDTLLDRGEVMRRSRRGDEIPHLPTRNRLLIDALTVTDGAPDEVDALLATTTDQRFLAWAHARLRDGPTWQHGPAHHP